MHIETKQEPRKFTAQEIAAVTKLFRETRGWSQETLAERSKLSVRTIQRVERGEFTDDDTRRALAVAFELAEVDFFNDLHRIPTEEETHAAQEKFDREHVLLQAIVTTSGRELGALYAASTMDVSSPAVELGDQAAGTYAALTDLLRDFRDGARDLSETDKLEVYADIQRSLDELNAAGVDVCYAVRKTSLIGKDWENKTPWAVQLVYLSAFHKDKVPEKMAVRRKVELG